MNDATTQFLEHIQPATGWRCLFVLPDKRHYWFQNVETMAAAALELDAQGKAVFHGCATFKSKKRKQENVDSARSLWLDLDAGLGKIYQDAGHAYRALEDWRVAVCLPVAVIVASGGGLHAYWPLRDPLDPVGWVRAASALRALAEQRGLHCDASSTVDIARILRPPGTHNRKILDENGKKLADVGGEPRLVRCGPLVGPYSVEELEPLFGKEVMLHLGTEHTVPSRPHISTPPGLATLGAVPAHLQGVSSDEALLNIYGNDPADPEIIARECAQVRRLWDTAGQLPEPEWYAVLGVLAHGGDQTRAAAHANSQGDARYRFADTEVKLNQAAKVGPTTCGRFAILHPAGCVGCRHAGTITTPLQLGRAQASKPPSALASAPPSDFTLPILPDPFSFRGMRLVVSHKPSEEDPSTSHVITEFPFVIEELQEAEHGKLISAVFRAWEPKQQIWRDFTLGLGEVLSPSGSSHLANRAVIIPKQRWGDFTRYVGTMVNTHKSTKDYGIRYDQFGWKDAGFLWGDRLFSPGSTPLRAYGSPAVEQRARNMQCSGAAPAWSAAVNRLFDQLGMEAHQFIILAAFAAPLYAFTGEIGGTIAHAQSTATGQAKTEAMKTGASVWGDLLATSIIQADTVVAKFVTLGTLNNLPVFFDELRSPDIDILKDMVLQFSLGRDKQRGNKDGGLRDDALPWSMIMISASNLSLVDAVRADGGETAHAARIFEFAVKLPPETRRADHTTLKEIIQENRGSAGAAFLQIVVEKRQEMRKQVREAMRFFEQALGDGTELRFVVRLFATVCVAGQICKEAGLLSFDVRRVITWAMATAQANQLRLDEDKQNDLASVIGAMINDMHPATMVMREAAKPGPRKESAMPLKSVNGEIKARYEVETATWECDVRAVRRWMHENNHPFSDIEKQLLAVGVLRHTNIQKTLTRGSGMPSSQVRVWEIDGNHEMIAGVVAPLGVVQESNVVPLRGNRP